MTDCHYCGNTCKGKYCHEECWQEYMHRRRSDLCTRCGDTILPDNGVWCDICDRQSDYKNYPGGAT